MWHVLATVVTSTEVSLEVGTTREVVPSLAGVLALLQVTGEESRREGERVVMSGAAWKVAQKKLAPSTWKIWDIPAWISQLLVMDCYCDLPDLAPDYKMQVWDQLYPYQQEGVAFCIARQGRAMLADEMGLGKTRQALAVIKYFEPTSLLVVCPSSLRSNWVAESSRCINQKLAPVHKRTDRVESFSVVSYSLSVTLPLRQALLDSRYDFVVLDESHYIKNQSSRRSRLALELAARARYVLLLSGTPLSRNQDLYTQLRAISKLSLGAFWPAAGKIPAAAAPAQYFAGRYTVPKLVPGGWDFKTNTRSSELSLLLKAVAVRRTKQAVLPQLPPKLRVFRAVGPLPVEKVEALRALKAAWTGSGSDSDLMKYVKLTSKLKLRYVLEYLRENLPATASDFKVLIFAHFHETLDSLAECCKSLEVPAVQIDGRCAGPVKDARVLQFQTESKGVAILGTTAAGTGLNLQQAQRVIFAELGWSAQDLLQAEDRAHRLGVQGEVVVTYLTLPESSDDLMRSVLEGKHQHASLVLENRKRKFFA